MNVLYLTIPMTFVISGGFLACFIWAMKSGQMDDVDTPAFRILNDDKQGETNERK